MLGWYHVSGLSVRSGDVYCSLYIGGQRRVLRRRLCVTTVFLVVLLLPGSLAHLKHDLGELGVVLEGVGHLLGVSDLARAGHVRSGGLGQHGRRGRRIRSAAGL